MDGDLFAPDAAAGRGPRGNIFTGTCSWTDPALIKTKRFYPCGCSSAEARLRYYASVFPIVEVDSSYYAMPTADNAVRWAERTPAAFRFNVKAFRLFTGHQAAPNTLPPDLLPLRRCCRPCPPARRTTTSPTCSRRCRTSYGVALSRPSRLCALPAS